MRAGSPHSQAFPPSEKNVIPAKAGVWLPGQIQHDREAVKPTLLPFQPHIRAGNHTIAFKDRVDFSKIRLPDIPPQRADIIFHLGRFATANQGCADRRMRERPAQRKLRQAFVIAGGQTLTCLLYTSPSPRDS